MTDKQDRQIEILQILKNRRQAKVLELAKDLHVSRATILRDLEDLSRAHYVLPGRNGGISVMEGCEISIPAMKTVHEQFLKSLLPRLQPGEQEMMEEILRTYSHKKFL